MDEKRLVLREPQGPIMLHFGEEDWSCYCKNMVMGGLTGRLKPEPSSQRVDCLQRGALAGELCASRSPRHFPIKREEGREWPSHCLAIPPVAFPEE